MRNDENLYQLRCEQSKRLNDAINEYTTRLTNAAIAKELGYEETYISKLRHFETSGKRIPARFAQLFEDEYGIRKNYILCVDGYKTEKDKQLAELKNGLVNMGYEALLPRHLPEDVQATFDGESWTLTTKYDGDRPKSIRLTTKQLFAYAEQIHAITEGLFDMFS